MKKRLSGFREVGFPEETEDVPVRKKPSGGTGGNRRGTERKKDGERPETKSRAEQKLEAEKAAKKQIVKDVGILIVFLLVALITVLLINRHFPKASEESPGTREEGTAGRQDGATDGSLSEEPSLMPSEPEETETPGETLPETAEAPTETPSSTEAPTETVPPSEHTADVTDAVPGEQPKMYPYRELQPGLSIPVQSGISMPSWVTQDLLYAGAPSRPGTAIGPIRHIVVHYVGNVGSSAKDNRDYFEGNVDGRKVSSHFVVGMYGEIIQCIPLNEVAYAQGVSQTLMNQGMVNHNYDSISIENCHPYSNGQFTTETYWALVKLCAWLLEQYGLGPDALMRHYDATTNTALGVHGKSCPLYFTEHPESWTQFKAAVGQYMKEHPDIR